MIQSEKRAAALKLLAEIDQNIAESDALARSKLLTPSDRNRVQVFREFYRMAAARTEKLLGR